MTRPVGTDNPAASEKTLRDEFAMAALAGMVSDPETVLRHHNIAKETDESGATSHRDVTAGFAYKYADALLLARKEDGQ